MKSRHGGARAGAGRKPDLTFRQCIRIGAECENRWNELTQAASLERAYEQARKRATAKVPKLNAPAALHDKQTQLQKVPLRHRKPRADYVRELIGDVRSLIKVMGGPLIIDEVRGAHGGLVRLKSQRQKVITDVAELMSKELGRTITRRAVERCWKMYRRFLVSTRNDSQT